MYTEKTVPQHSLWVKNGVDMRYGLIDMASVHSNSGN